MTQKIQKQKAAKRGFKPTLTDKPRFIDTLTDTATVKVQKRTEDAYKYLVHCVLIKPEHRDKAVGNTGWIPGGLRVAGLIALRMDFKGSLILGNSIQNVRHNKWTAAINTLGVFDDAMTKLNLSPDLKKYVAWKADPRDYFQRNIWIRGHWQLLRIQEENRQLTIKTYSLAEIVTAAEAKAKAAGTEGQTPAVTAKDVQKSDQE